MENKITFKTWVSVLFGGIWQFIRNIFSWKNKTPFWRVVWAVITLCILAVTCMLVYAFYHEFTRDNSWKYSYDPQLSADFKYRNNGHDKGNSYIYNSRTRKKVMTGIDWIAVPEDGDSLMVVAKGGKRGFVNRHTAKVAIPFRYDAAWSFTDGVAAVCEGDSVYFIDHSGTPINSRKFPRLRGYDNYAFHGQYAAIPSGGKYGLIDRSGAWVVSPEYDRITIGARNMWVIADKGQYGVLGADARFVMPMQYEYAWIHPSSGITVGAHDHSQSRYDYEGNLLDAFIFDEVHHLDYYINDFDDEGNQKRAIDPDMLAYSTNNYFGLMTKEGHPVTPPSYARIEAVSPGIYQCRLPDSTDCILLDRTGHKIND